MTRLPDLGPRGEGWVVLQFVLLALVAVSGLFGGDGIGAGMTGMGSLAGLALMLAGAALLGRGLIDLGANLTPVPRPRDDSQLVESGVYALVRHPLYGGLTLTAFGWSLVVSSLLTLLLAIGLAAFFTLKSRREEVWLLARYPGYAAYMKRTRRLIPWLF